MSRKGLKYKEARIERALSLEPVPVEAAFVSRELKRYFKSDSLASSA